MLMLLHYIATWTRGQQLTVIPTEADITQNSILQTTDWQTSHSQVKVVSHLVSLIK